MLANAPLRVLIVDDSEHDARLVALALRHGGLEVVYERVDTAEGLRARLAGDPYDVVLTDHAMPAFDSLAVLAIVRSGPDPPPVIVVSGQIGEETLTRAFHAGAADYVSKDRLNPLLSEAVKRALQGQLARRERDEANWKLRQQEKAVAMGTFVKGVAHEINNPLSYMTMNAELARQTLQQLRQTHASDAAVAAAADESLQAIDTIARGSARIKSIVQGLQRVALGEERSRAVVDARDLVRSALLTPPPGIELVEELVGGGDVLVEASDIREVIRSILRNAYESMVGKGAGRVRVSTFEVPGGIRIEVADEGAGIPFDLQPQVFTPFFTTKHTGVGLSLSIARRMIEDNGGSISFVSTPGVGTTFRVDLPAAQAPATPLVVDTGGVAR